MRGGLLTCLTQRQVPLSGPTSAVRVATEIQTQCTEWRTHFCRCPGHIPGAQTPRAIHHVHYHNKTCALQPPNQAACLAPEHLRTGGHRSRQRATLPSSQSRVQVWPAQDRRTAERQV